MLQPAGAQLQPAGLQLEWTALHLHLAGLEPAGCESAVGDALA